jgi:CII-binding regulator of phage lambda lysogenization HflD
LFDVNEHQLKENNKSNSNTVNDSQETSVVNNEDEILSIVDDAEKNLSQDLNAILNELNKENQVRVNQFYSFRLCLMKLHFMINGFMLKNNH